VVVGTAQFAGQNFTIQINKTTINNKDKVEEAE